MTTMQGFITGEMIVANREDLNFTTPSRDIITSKGEGQLITPIPFGDRVVSTPVSTSKLRHGGLAGLYGNDFIWDRIWFYPTSITEAFITETLEYTIRIWNAHRSEPIEVSDIVAYDQTGTYLDYPTTPFDVPRFATETMTLTIFKDGPATQNTTYRVTIDGVDYDLTITGVRILPFPYEPNWDANPKIELEFQTHIWASKYLNEKRRPLSAHSWITFSGSYDLQGVRFQQVQNLISYGKDKVYGIPVFSEKIIPTEIEHNGLAITCSENLDYHYFLQNKANNVMIINFTTGENEVKYINSIVDNVINLDNRLNNYYENSETYVYPCIFAYVRAVKGQPQTDNFMVYDIDFKEFKPNG